MNNITRARINLREGLIELEGSEQFVSRYLDEFKELSNLTQQDSSLNREKTAPRVKIKKSDKSKEASGSGRKSKTIGNIDIEEFEVKATKENSNKSLKDFFESKNPPRDRGPARIIVMSYYIVKYAKIDEFSAGHIEFAFKALQLRNRPAHLQQVLINLKNSQKWLNPGTDGKWKLSRIGELYVDENLPPKKDNE